MADIVIVDDASSILHLLQHTVSLLGWTSDVATNGEDALAIAERVKPALVLSDVNMPKMDGFALLRLLKSNPVLAHVPVVLMSGLVGEAEANAADCAAYFAKPFQINAIIQTLPQFVDQEPVCQPSKS
jgi:two-component system, cell cycle response regulator